MKSTSPYSIKELNNMVECFRGIQEKRVHNYRLKGHKDTEKKSTKTDKWDLPLTVCSCGSRINPFIAANGRNCSALKTPHNLISTAYNNIKDNYGKTIIGSIPLGTKPNNRIKKLLHLKGVDSFEAGRCAEPHAANSVLTQIKKMSTSKVGISDLVFSVALDARYPIVKPYCVTCRCVFPQLR
jgi:hypothetical protein